MNRMYAVSSLTIVVVRVGDWHFLEVIAVAIAIVNDGREFIAAD